MKIVLDRRAPAELRSHATATLPDWATFVDVARADAAFADHLADADVLLHVLDPVTADDLARATSLRLIQKFGTGVNTIDLDAAERHDVAVTNMPGANAPAVAELTLALILTGLRDVVALHAGTIDGSAWPGGPGEPPPGAELGGRTVGLVGYGAIARRVEQAVRAIGARTIHHATTTDREGWVTLDELVAQADVVSLHVPLTPATEQLFDRARLSATRAGVVVVNTSRGGLVDHDALVDLVRSGHIGAAGLDVFPQEPLPTGHPLLHTERITVTPHVAWYTSGTLVRCWDRALENCRRLRDGEPLEDRVR
jgi:phosphoglycerate dehydrogenase-like enzyme